MITISEQAKKKVAQLMQDAKYDDRYFIRVSVVGGGCRGLSYKMDFDSKLQQNEQIFEDKGVKIICDRKSILYLFGTELDFSDGLNGKGFQFHNPNATRTCSCGESFAV